MSLTGFVDPIEAKAPRLTVPKCEDFSVTGRGEAESWKLAEWTSLKRRPKGAHEYTARFKMLYSETGIYVLFDGTDKTLTATMKEDFLDLWNEDVFECFFWTDEKHPVYFEYEISPLGYELPILVPKLNGKFLGWRPWHYEGDRRVVKNVSAIGGASEINGVRYRLARRGVYSVRTSQAIAECSTGEGDNLASEFLSR